MSSRTPITAIICLGVTLVASMKLSSEVSQRRAQQTIKAPEGQRLVRAGFNKFLSQIAWMRLIQLRGSMDKVDKVGAASLAKKYEHLTNLDPMFATAYEEGALDIGWENPTESIKLLNKAMEVDRLKSWKLPFTAGFLAKTQMNDVAASVKYLEIATKVSGCPSYVRRYLINLKSEMYANDPIRILNLWIDYYGGGPGRIGDLSNRGMSMGGMGGGGGLSEQDRKFALSQISRLSSSIIADTQKVQATDKSPEGKIAAQGRMEQVQKLVKQVYAGSHICTFCYRPYNAGDKFCVYDGKPVDAFGICAKDGAVVHGAFCQKCGTKVN